MADEFEGEIVESSPEQTEPHVQEAVPDTEIVPTVADVPTDYGEPGLADFPDVAFGEEPDDSLDLPTPDETWDDDDIDDQPHDQERA